MKILGFGKKETYQTDDPFKGMHQEDRVGDKEEENIDVITDDLSNNLDNRIEDDNMENNPIEEEDNYIDWDYIEYTYEELLEHIEGEEWIPITGAGLCQFTHFNANIVVTKPVKKNTYDNILEITCPLGELITICGFNECDVDEDEFFDSPNLYARPHFFAIRCTDDNHNELPATTIIGISKITRDNKIEKLYQEFYGDLSSTIGGKFKRKKERYYFAETIILQGGEKLLLDAYWPLIDISNIELLMMCDRFRKDVEEEDDDDRIR